jgi:hypothetical protein
MEELISKIRKQSLAFRLFVFFTCTVITLFIFSLIPSEASAGISKAISNKYETLIFILLIAFYAVLLFPKKYRNK